MDLDALENWSGNLVQAYRHRPTPLVVPFVSGGPGGRDEKPKRIFIYFTAKYPYI
jgi:hypothetical protein